MKRQSCFFIGHRETSSDVFSALVETVEQHISEYGVTEFVVGRYGAFDHMAAKVVINAKIKHPEISLFLLLPYHPAERPIDLPVGYDGSFYPPEMEKVPRRLAIVRANRYMVDHSDYLIAHVWHPASNARELLEYAQKRAQKRQLTITVLQR